MYWSKQDRRVVHRYHSSLFVGHSDADTLVRHYLDFVNALGLDSSMLLHFRMDGPNTNFSFEREMVKYLEEMNTSFLMTGTCSLHSAHSASVKGIKKLLQGTFREISASKTDKTGSFNMNNFFQDLHFFFKYSSARREDYALLASIAGVTTEYMKKHAETCWVSIKYVALCCLEQRENLKEHFLKFLPQQKNFKKEVEKTQRYLRTKTALSKPIMEAYVLFVAFVAHDFQEFLVPFQSTEPMIHLLYPALCKLMNVLQRKFIRKIKLSSDDTTKKVGDVGDDRNIKPLSKIDVGAKAFTECHHGL